MYREIKLPGLLGEGCVLQRGEHTNVWGWYSPGQTVTIEFQENVFETRTDENGRFETHISCTRTGGPFSLKFTGEDGITAKVAEVYVGDVFVLAGQSNMELPMNRVKERFPEELAEGCADVHHYKVLECTEFAAPREDHAEAFWSRCQGEALKEASALAYFFGKMISEHFQIPVGIINTSLGGSPVEAWTSVEGLAEYPDFLAVKKQFEDETFRKELLKRQEEAEDNWHKNLAEQEKETAGNPWNTLVFPGFFQGQKGLEDFSGLLWLRSSFLLTKEQAKNPALLRLGTLTDSDRTFINGIQVGETGYSFPPRRYQVPEGVFKEGINEVCIHLTCRDGKGRVTPDKPYDIVFSSGDIVTLDGPWEYQIRGVSESAPVLEFIRRKPTGLYQGMTAPCLPATVKGVVWYQGESNDREPYRYQKLLKGMIEDWRMHWSQERLPFIIIQLPVCHMDIAEGDSWAIIRQAQSQAECLPEVAVTVNLDLGEYNDLHPVDKKGVAYRAYRAARYLMYGEDILWQGPRLISLEKRNDKIIAVFDTMDGQDLETADHKQPEEFEAVDIRGNKYALSAEIQGDHVILKTDRINTELIEYIRYGWSDAPSRGLLCNHAGFLTGPFQKKLGEG